MSTDRVNRRKNLFILHFTKKSTFDKNFGWLVFKMRSPWRKLTFRVQGHESKLPLFLLFRKSVPVACILKKIWSYSSIKGNRTPNIYFFVTLSPRWYSRFASSSASKVWLETGLYGKILFFWWGTFSQLLSILSVFIVTL